VRTGFDRNTLRMGELERGAVVTPLQVPPDECA
jgi:hypothetical protein